MIDGEIVTLGQQGFDFGALLKRVHPAASRIERLRAETPASFGPSIWLPSATKISRLEQIAVECLLDLVCDGQDLGHVPEGGSSLQVSRWACHWRTYKASSTSTTVAAVRSGATSAPC